MKRLILFMVAATSFYMLFMEGFAFPTLSPAVSVLLRILCALCVQTLFLSFQNRLLRPLPLVLTALMACRGLWLWYSSPAWQYATLGGYLAEYVSPALACGAAYLLSALCKSKNKNL